MAADFHDYLHRIGRTGRIGHEGRSTLIFGKTTLLNFMLILLVCFLFKFSDPNTDYRHANPLYECLKARNQAIPKWLFDYLSLTQLIK